MPSLTAPNTAWLPLSQGVATVVRKNWEPLVPGPALAMDRTPGLSCLRAKAEGSQGSASRGHRYRLVETWGPLSAGTLPES